jgi:hypothetical protein
LLERARFGLQNEPSTIFSDQVLLLWRQIPFGVFAMLEIAALSKFELSSCAVEDSVVKVFEASAAVSLQILRFLGSVLVLHIFGNKDLFWPEPYFLHGF